MHSYPISVENLQIWLWHVVDMGNTMERILVYSPVLWTHTSDFQIVNMQGGKNSIPYCYYYKRVLILANIGDLVITAKFCARY